MNLLNFMTYYRDSAINKRILKMRKTLIIRSHPNKDWGNKELDELLKKYNVKPTNNQINK